MGNLLAEIESITQPRRGNLLAEIEAEQDTGTGRLRKLESQGDREFAGREALRKYREERNRRANPPDEIFTKSFLSGATLGGSKIIPGMDVTDDERRANPYGEFAGEIAGSALPFQKASTLAASGMRALAPKLGINIGTRILAAEAGVGTAANRAAVVAAREAVAGGATGLAQETSDALRGESFDPENIAYGAAGGAAFGAAGEGIGEIARAIRAKSSLAKGMQPDVEKFRAESAAREGVTYRDVFEDDFTKQSALKERLTKSVGESSRRRMLLEKLNAKNFDSRPLPIPEPKTPAQRSAEVFAQSPEQVVSKAPPVTVQPKKEATVLHSVSGGLAGFEQDDEGNVRFNPEKALLGIGLGVAGIATMNNAKQIRGKLNPLFTKIGTLEMRLKYTTQPEVKAALNAELSTLRKQADDLASSEIVKTTDEAVNNAGDAISREPVVRIPDEQSSTQFPRFVNTDRLNISDEAKAAVNQAIKTVRPQLEKVRGKPMTHAEVIEAAKTADVLKGAISYDEVLANNAKIQATRQAMAAMAVEGKMTKEFLEAVKTVSAAATEAGRTLNAFAIHADPAESSLLVKMAKAIIKNDKVDIEKFLAEANAIDFNDGRQAVAFYRKFEKAKFSEWLDEFRMGNMLSSPRTHITNAASNLAQVVGLRPAVKLFSAGYDAVGSALTGKQREIYLREVPAYYRGAVNNIGDAFSKATDVLTGKIDTHRFDLNKTPTGSKLLVGHRKILQALEAGDVFFRTMATGGELEALAVKAAKSKTVFNRTKALKDAEEIASKTVFRGELDPANASGQGSLLSYMDKVTGLIQQGRKLPGVKWFIPFVQTPMNILKQGVEYSPAGFATLLKNEQKAEQLAKATIGSLVFAGAGMLAIQGRTTWGVPRGEKERDLFFASGMKPYSVRIGDKWVSYSKIGPLAYPLAMAAAFRYHFADSPDKLTDDYSEKMEDALFAVGGFFSDQSYMEGLQSLLDVTRGDKRGVAAAANQTASQLVPFASLLRWVNGFIDPIYRKKNNELTVEGIATNLSRGIPGLSQFAPAYKDRFGQEQRRYSPAANAFSPVEISQDDPAGRENYELQMLIKQRKRLIDFRKEQLKQGASR